MLEALEEAARTLQAIATRLQTRANVEEVKKSEDGS